MAGLLLSVVCEKTNQCGWLSALTSCFFLLSCRFEAQPPASASCFQDRCQIRTAKPGGMDSQLFCALMLASYLQEPGPMTFREA